MIVRARPRYLEVAELDNLPPDLPRGSGFDNELYFNKARAALKFYIEQLNLFTNRKNRVATQAFNCEVVGDAVIEAGSTLVLMDVKLEDASISLEELKKTPELDVLILTHYQGLPNIEYHDIVDYCRSNNIVIIDDICLTEGSCIGTTLVGSLSDVALKSFAFDKPVTCLNGGSLTLNTECEFNEYLKEKYRLIQVESKRHELASIRALGYKLKYTNINIYYSGANATDVLVLLSYLKVPEVIIRMMSQWNFFVRVSNSLISRFRSKEIKIIRLGKHKKNLIGIQNDKKGSIEKPINKDSIKKWILDVSPKCTFFQEYECSVHWNRFSLIDESGELVEFLKSKDIEAGNHNWPKTLDEHLHGNNCVEIFGELENSKHLAKYIVNIPTWIDLEEYVKY
ncbi:DegT/DnrJ/EryC1/StrS family aminotransferase [Enterovibrio norvegicus]|uniref:DegT/DnrJ/EryC1/StrS aminotransferase family protein n=1 Tax=Enterovibrio norvegicus DSM 15893 TaxID=1121869 RepID=A0A1I5N8W4_9GAMM|nr:DegT/DnrJ/EryC1/StrS family aminotransferase [Enterovibrio norvegicus]SFP18173.1 DegT/DnrJ/EryC1/StrS aminotransferase family protein [Enterovibrio norvegicus DSM 15893]